MFKGGYWTPKPKLVQLHKRETILTKKQVDTLLKSVEDIKEKLEKNEKSLNFNISITVDNNHEPDDIIDEIMKGLKKIEKTRGVSLK